MTHSAQHRRTRHHLPARWHVLAELLMHCRRFSGDALFIAADALAEFACDADMLGAPDMAAEARGLATRLRDAGTCRARQDTATGATHG
ncbi:hypothetical protein AA103196_2297 [Ameyamaea chiangmaiensis NBRC 103196]|uniref:Uncharacterized protein n=1 Tax=Ameyamaea chiangmaiensis TaxID=442969 RepID=A0A850P5D6_9PROT|nr:hypothetical protein [Ameyamaea chiangmaiensis]MBS4075443.1 hypothetical protein [Ameyamaea chiangmaiensis]NVN39024.1 hypothetical protein [Ameyamaea chiangmaiensis]GBQ69742.1 hypothetical protein AA103196_2297 [Ameyamaea chiangmaiensis NBRC 103196]